MVVLHTGRPVSGSEPKKKEGVRDNMEPGADIICLDFNIKEKHRDESLHLMAWMMNDGNN